MVTQGHRGLSLMADRIAVAFSRHVDRDLAAASCAGTPALAMTSKPDGFPVVAGRQLLGFLEFVLQS